MKPVKLRLIKRSGKKGDEYEASIPTKRHTDKGDKENKATETGRTPPPKTRSRASKVLSESLPTIKENSIRSGDEGDDDDDDGDDDDFAMGKLSSDEEDIMELFQVLKKSGIKISPNNNKSESPDRQKKKKKSREESTPSGKKHRKEDECRSDTKVTPQSSSKSARHSRSRAVDPATPLGDSKRLRKKLYEDDDNDVTEESAGTHPDGSTEVQSASKSSRHSRSRVVDPSTPSADTKRLRKKYEDDENDVTEESASTHHGTKSKLSNGTGDILSASKSTRHQRTRAVDPGTPSEDSKRLRKKLYEDGGDDLTPEKASTRCPTTSETRVSNSATKFDRTKLLDPDSGTPSSEARRLRKKLYEDFDTSVDVKREIPSDTKPSRSTTKSNRLDKSKLSESATTPLSEGRRVRKKLNDDFDDLDESGKVPRLQSAKKVPELEKLPEDLILNYKRTPKKIARYDVEYETHPLVRSVEKTPVSHADRTTPRRHSVRAQSYKEILLNDLETTPRRRSTRTPRKSILVQPTTPKTPTNSKIEERLPTTPLEKAWLKLRVAAVPDGLPCREKEFNNILTFLKNKLWDGIGGCMYISGVPGTGKTATVNQVIRHLQEGVRSGDIPDFKFIEINGMRLADPRQAYVQLWQKLFDKKEKISADHAQKLLDAWFSKSDRKNEKKTTVLLVDELDLICTKKQDVVYNLLDWPTRTHSRLVVLTIANTMDMPERFFKGRITSRMGLTRLTFMPYTYKQLEEIVSERLRGLDAFVPDAVQLVTRKVAAVSGDARRALDICRRAAELPAPEDTVTIKHIEQAIKEMTNSNIVKLIKGCGQMEKLFLRSLCDVSFRSNLDEVDMLKVIEQLLAVCVLEGIPRPSVSSILTVANRLKCSRLIFANQSSPGILQRVMLNVTQDDIHYALQT